MVLYSFCAKIFLIAILFLLVAILCINKSFNYCSVCKIFLQDVHYLNFVNPLAAPISRFKFLYISYGFFSYYLENQDIYVVESLNWRFKIFYFIFVFSFLKTMFLNISNLILYKYFWDMWSLLKVFYFTKEMFTFYSHEFLLKC